MDEAAAAPVVGFMSRRERVQPLEASDLATARPRPDPENFCQFEVSWGVKKRDRKWKGD